VIVGKRFVWLHFPKCAGHAVEQAIRSVLRKDRNAVFDSTDNAGWHDSLDDRDRRGEVPALAGREVVCGFRRLPHWILSRVHYEASRPPYLSATRDMLLRGEFFHRNGQVARADDFARHYDASHVDRWIRTEHLAADFLAAFEDLIGPGLARVAARRLGRIVNGTRLNYIRDLEYHFTAEELEGLYAANPIWAERELALYGELLTVPARLDQARYFVDRRLTFISASPAALEAWGKSVDEVVGRHMLEVFPAGRGSEPYAAHLVALRTMQRRLLHTRSPTYHRPAVMEFEPRRTGLQVIFEMSA
jgi:hypothetical protein